MNDYLAPLIKKYRNQGILLDTNILLLYLIGKFDKNLILKFKRTQTFTIQDYEILTFLLSKFNKIITLPNILTEISNLSGKLESFIKQNYFQIFAQKITIFSEHYIPSEQIRQKDAFKRFGITDAGILILAKDKYLVLTDDFRLSQYLQFQGIDVLNFNHLRIL